MRIITLKSAVFAAMLMCFSGNASAQINLGDILGSVTGKSSSSTGNAGNLISNLTSVFSGKKQASKNQIVGTWEYSEPAIVFDSDNLLAKAGAKLAANKLEKKIQEYLTKYGVKPGAMKITFAEDGTFKEILNGRTINGKWKIENSKLILTYGTVKPVSITTQVEGKTLLIVTDATQLLNFMKTIGSKSTNANIKTITTLMNSINGMKAGLTLVKK